MALVLLLVALPTGFYFARYADSILKGAMAERRQKAASQMANSAVADYFRQFSQDSYNGHFDPASLERPESFYSAGYSTVTFIPDSINRTLYLKAEGVYGTPERPRTRRVLEAMVQFSSDLVQYGTMVNGAFTVSASNVRYDGGFYTNGNLSITGANVRFNGGPVVVKGNLSGAASVVIDGDLYYSGGSAGSVSVTGTKYNYVPSVNWPTLNFGYYDAHYTYKTTTAKTIVFNSTGTFTVVGGATYAIPPDGALIYGENTNLTVRGIVSGRVSVIAGAAAAGNCSSGTGKITVGGDLYYVNASSIAAAANASFGALARNCVSFDKTGSDLLAVGVYFVEQGTSNMRANGSSGRTLKIYGVRTQGISMSGFSSASINYDVNLRSFQPPGLPERALLVNWNLH
ncbi:MAG: hypothetical protein A2X36_13950 [Elusimicrobia bacterium GWA2_69_24]|nr:MAG: hypothetical protein A2X36_13950 [Elusimicrobia bacterium GWA2_69_24]HBL16696.1 hypothetical protein [Elusimicrobiota bacterium]